jgi:hypothetical protein
MRLAAPAAPRHPSGHVPTAPKESAMPPDLPLSRFLVEVVRHTPLGVWMLLAVLVALGLRQLRAHELGRARVLALPLAMGAFSLWGALSSFGVQAPVLAAWALGLGAVAAWGPRWPRQVQRVAADRYLVAGSVLPLAAMLAVFATRYALSVTFALHRDWAADAAVAIGASLLYGMLSGLFAARARHILRSPAA